MADGPFRGLEPDVAARRASSFGATAAVYARARPGYPGDAVRWLLEPGPRRILDLGAGTGKLTEALLRCAPAADVIAVEPDEAMLAQLRTTFMVRAEAGSAESIPLPDNSVDLVVAGQALHWFDLNRALAEIARVLTPGGVLGGIWNLDDDRVGWVARYKQLTHSSVSFTTWHPELLSISQGGYFTDPEWAAFQHTEHYTTSRMLAALTTHSQVSILPEAERDELLEQARGYLEQTPETAGGEFELPIVTKAVRASVRAAPARA